MLLTPVKLVWPLQRRLDLFSGKNIVFAAVLADDDLYDLLNDSGEYAKLGPQSLGKEVVAEQDDLKLFNATFRRGHGKDIERT
jgi:hypothetical protein